MRILIAAEHLGPLGGMERTLDIVLPALVARGHTVHAIARRIDRAPDGVSAEAIAWSDEHDAPDAVAAQAAARAIDAFRPDVAMAHNVMDAGIVTALRRVRRATYVVHDHRPFCPNGDRVFPRAGGTCTARMGVACAVHALLDGCAYGPRPSTGRLIRRRSELADAIAACDVVFVASAYVAARCIQHGVDASRIATIAPPLPDEAFRETPVPATTNEVLFVGRVVPQKGLDVLVRALARIAAGRPSLCVVGDGPALPAVRAEAARLGVDLRAAGSATPAGVRDAMDCAALVAVPSRWAEPFGYVGIEAFARGRPVIAFATGGVPAWLRDGENGLAIAPGDDRRFARGIQSLAASPAERERLGSNARRSAEAYRTDAIVDAIVERLHGS